MKSTRKLLVVAAVVLALVVVSAGIVYAITNGEPDGDAHPYVGLIVFDVGGGPAWRCSGALIAPNVVLTAGHCTDGAEAARVWFDEIVEGNLEYPFSGATSYDGIPYTMPGYGTGSPGRGLPAFDYHDIGVVVLTESVTCADVDRCAILPAAGLVDEQKNKTDIDLVGYGVQELAHIPGEGPPFWTGLKNRLYAPSKLVSGKFVHSDEFMKLSMNPGGGTGGSCFGDSGGPDLLGDTDTILAVNSYVTNYNCRGVGYSNRIDTAEALAFINSFLP